jgi:hypothetical protein
MPCRHDGASFPSVPSSNITASTGSAIFFAKCAKRRAKPSFIDYRTSAAEEFCQLSRLCVPEKDCLMRIALLASTFAFLAASPAFAQCVYVACSGQAQGGPTYQQPAYQPPAAPMPAPGASSGYDEGYAAGLAARPAGRHTATRGRTAQRATPVRARSAPARGHVAAAPKRKATVARSHGAPAATRRAVAAPTRAHSAPRRGVATRAVARRSAQVTNTSYTGSYQDPIKDRASTYRPAVYGQSTSMASMMSSSSSSSYTTTWTGPATHVRQGGQICGWGARIVTNHRGYSQRQAVWVCQCPQGWRPPGY